MEQPTHSPKPSPPLDDALAERPTTAWALHAKEAELRLIADSTPVLLARCTRDRRYLFVNRAWAERFGLTPEQVVGRRIPEIMGAEAYATIRPYVDRVLQGEALEFEQEIPYRRMGRRFMRVAYVPERDEHGTVVGWVASISDITDQKQAEELLREAHAQLEQRVLERTAELRESEEILERLFQFAPDAMVVTDAAGRIVRVNQREEALFGYAPQELIGKRVEVLLPRRLRRQHVPHRQGYSAQPRIRPMGRGLDLLGRRKDGTEFPVDIMLAPLPTRDGPLMMAVIRDITVRRRLERELVEITERERERIGQELHDTLGQTLAGVAFMSEALERKLHEESRAAAPLAATIAQRIKTAAGQAHGLAWNLFPLELEGGGLMSALREMAGTVTSLYGIPCRCVRSGPTGDPEPLVAGQLFRIAQEAATNAAKHSHGTRIEIRLAGSHQSLTLTVRDNGVGLKPPPAKSKKMGLHILHHRANLIGATLEFRRGKQGGTVVACRVEYQPGKSKP